LVAGRSFSPLDNQGSPPAAIVNQAAAQRFWPGEDFLGKHLMLPEVDPKKTWQVVGVTVDERMYGSDTKPHPQVYVPYLQHPMPNFDLVVQAFGDPAKLGAVVRGQVSSVDKAIDVVRIETMEQTLSDSVLIPRQYAVLAGGLAVLALILAAAGVYGLMSYSVTQRTHEMGIRMALGAERNDVLKLVVGEALGLAALGVTLGVFGALELTRSLSTLLYGVAPTDPRTFAGASLLLAATALVAGYVPARRATKVDPVIALRYE
jgi:putative ABC transport system permease protein